MKKNYVIDTNVMIHDPNFLKNFEDNNIIIPLICIEELDHLKKENSIRGYNSRTVLKEINKIRNECKDDTTLDKGILLSNGGSLRIETDKVDKYKLPDAMSIDKNDNKILAITKAISLEQKIPTILVTKDVALTIKADSIGVTVQDYENDKIEVETLYKGILDIYVPTDIINTIHALKKINIEDISEYLKDSEGNNLICYPNQYIILTSCENPKAKVFTRCLLDEKTDTKFLELRNKNLDELTKNHKVAQWLIEPRNIEQKICLDLLNNDSIPFITMSGSAGCGKTILAVSVALQKLAMEEVSKVVLIRPIVPAGDDIGYLPGTEEEKLKPWMGAYYDAIETILKNKGEQTNVEEYVARLQQEGKLEIKSFTYMRGRTITDAFIIIDEAQEITPHIAKLMLTRGGEKTKIVMTGDPSDNQIDNSLVNSKTNGLVYVIEKCKNSNLTAHIELQKVERSPLTELFNKVL